MNIGVNRIMCGLLGNLCKNIFHIQSEQGSLRKEIKGVFFIVMQNEFLKRPNTPLKGKALEALKGH